MIVLLIVSGAYGARIMKFQRCSNLDCRRPYQVNEFTGRKSSASTPEEIVCPHCGHTETRWSDSVFLVHALSPEQEAEFDDGEAR